MNQDGRWKIISCVASHQCGRDRIEARHRQLTSGFIGQRLKHAIAKQPTQSASQLQDYISMVFEYNVNYGKAWRAKRLALKMVYDD